MFGESRAFVATLAQLVEHLTRSEKVLGSIPRGGSNDDVSVFMKHGLLYTKRYEDIFIQNNN